MTLLRFMNKNNKYRFSDEQIEPEFNQESEPQRGKKIVPKKLERIKQTKPLQLSLFEILTETDILTEDGSKQLKTGRNYTQTIELYDFMPRFVWGHQADVRRNYNGLLPGLVRDFECRGIPFRLTLTAATIVQSSGESIAYYPGADEDILETVLRKIYLDGDPKLYDGQPGMTFTVNQLRKEMKRQGHTRSHKQILESLEILKKCQIDVVNLDSGKKMIFNTIDVLSYNERAAGDEPCYLIFSKLLADALDGLYFRRLNYKQVVGYKSSIARLLHRRISHHFTQANEEISYRVNLSTLLRDFGLEYPTLRKAFFVFKKSIEEMKEAGVIKDFEADPIISSKDKRKIEDYYLRIIPTRTFSFEMKNSNIVNSKITGIYEQMQEKNISPKLLPKKESPIFPFTKSSVRSKDK